MQEYPIYKHLVQFSNLVDENGNLQQVVMDETPANVNGGRPNIQNARNDDEQEVNNGSQKSASQHEGGDVESLGSAYEGGDGED